MSHAAEKSRKVRTENWPLDLVLWVTGDLNSKGFEDMVEMEANVGSYRNVRYSEHKQCIWGVLLERGTQNGMVSIGQNRIKTRLF